MPLSGEAYQRPSTLLTRPSRLISKKHQHGTTKGESLRRQGNYVEAIQVFNKAIELDPNHGDAWNNLCKALKSLGDNSVAAAAFAKAKELGYNA